MREQKHFSHKTRGSDSSLYDEVCIYCGATDKVPGGWGKLAEPCPKNKMPSLDNNWISLISECEGLYGKKFTNKEGEVYVFAGLVHDDEDYSYLMLDKDRKALFLSCVGNLDIHGFKQIRGDK